MTTIVLTLTGPSYSSALPTFREYANRGTVDTVIARFGRATAVREVSDSGGSRLLVSCLGGGYSLLADAGDCGIPCHVA